MNIAVKLLLTGVFEDFRKRAFRSLRREGAVLYVEGVRMLKSIAFILFLLSLLIILVAASIFLLVQGFVGLISVGFSNSAAIGEASTGLVCLAASVGFGFYLNSDSLWIRVFRVETVIQEFIRKQS